jgi:hypothetical protein
VITINGMDMVANPPRVGWRPGGARRTPVKKLILDNIPPGWTGSTGQLQRKVWDIDPTLTARGIFFALKEFQMAGVFEGRCLHNAYGGGTGRTTQWRRVR